MEKKIRIKQQPQQRVVVKNSQAVFKVQQTLSGYIESYSVRIENKNDAKQHLYLTQARVDDLLSGPLAKMKRLKYMQVLKVRLQKIANNDLISKDVYFKSKTRTVINEHSIRPQLENDAEIIKHSISVWLSEGSGWIIQEVLSHYVNIAVYKPLR